MYLFNVVTFLFVFHVVKSDVSDNVQCQDVFRDINNNRTIVDIKEYCNNKLCLTKCCGAGEILNVYSQCMETKSKRVLHSKINYHKIDLYSWDGAEVKISQKKFTDFVLVRNDRLIVNDTCFYEYWPDRTFFILEDGSLKLKEDKNSLRPWTNVDKLTFCVDYKVVPYLTKNNVTKGKITLIFRETLSTEEAVAKSKFTAIAMLVSCFFMVLVLVVYGSLRQLRNISGLMLMAYVWSLLVTYLLKVVIMLTISKLSGDACKKLAPVFYFAALSSFFWLNIMSFDIWWTLRGHRICRNIHRQGETVKFLWYCLYGWGAPLLITTIVTILDNVDLEGLPLKPALHQCFGDDDVVTVYINVPVGIIIAANIMFFIMTAYNIWLIKKGVNNSQESRNSKRDTNRFGVYIKLSVIMGLGWILELVPDVSLVWYIMINFNNMLVGATIFFLFVFKKKIFVMLCKRFDLQKEYIHNLENEQSRTTSGFTGTTNNRSILKSSTRQTRESKL